MTQPHVRNHVACLDSTVNCKAGKLSLVLFMLTDFMLHMINDSKECVSKFHACVGDGCECLDVWVSVGGCVISVCVGVVYLVCVGGWMCNQCMCGCSLPCVCWCVSKPVASGSNRSICCLPLCEPTYV